MNLSIIGEESSFLNYSDNAMSQSANAADKAKVSTLQSENKKLQEEVNKLTTDNQALQTRIAQFKTAAKVDISSEVKGASEPSRELSAQSKEFAATNNINYANDSKNFSSQNVLSQVGSLTAAQSTKVSPSASTLVNKT